VVSIGRAAVIAVAMLSACRADVDPCPQGFRVASREDRCVPAARSDSAAPLDHDDAAMDTDPTRVPAEGDSAAEALVDAGPQNAAEAATDASGSNGTAPALDGSADMDASPLDGRPTDLDAMSVSDASDLDAQAPDRAIDGELPDAEDAAPSDAEPFDARVPACSMDDTAAWRALHLRPDLRVVLENCNKNCEAGVDCFDRCLRQASGVQACEPCTRAQSACATAQCGYVCLFSSSDRNCLACLCQTDCMAEFTGCAERDLEICSPALLASDAHAGKGPLRQPAMVFGKSVTGLLKSALVDSGAGTVGADVHVTHIPPGPARFVDLMIGGSTYAFFHTRTCTKPPCTALAHPLLEDGTFGVPLSAGRWDADYIDLETFSAQGATYLLRTRAPTAGMPETVLIDHLELDAEGPRLVPTSAARATLLSGTQQYYDRAEAFAFGDDAYLLLHAPRSGEGRFFRVAPKASGVELVPASGAFFLSKGWDRIEAFRSGENWFLFGLKTGSAETSDEPPGQVHIWSPKRDAQGRVTLESIFTEYWGDSLKHIFSFAGESGLATFVLYAPVAAPDGSDVLEVYQLGPTPSNWRTDFLAPTVRKTRKGNPPWDTIALLRQGKW
jgi:hypothetical protein